MGNSTAGCRRTRGSEARWVLLTGGQGRHGKRQRTRHSAARVLGWAQSTARLCCTALLNALILLVAELRWSPRTAQRQLAAAHLAPQVCLSFYEKRQRQSWFRWAAPSWTCSRRSSRAPCQAWSGRTAAPASGRHLQPRGCHRVALTPAHPPAWQPASASPLAHHPPGTPSPGLAAPRRSVSTGSSGWWTSRCWARPPPSLKSSRRSRPRRCGHSGGSARRRRSRSASQPLCGTVGAAQNVGGGEGAALVFAGAQTVSAATLRGNHNTTVPGGRCAARMFGRSACDSARVVSTAAAPLMSCSLRLPMARGAVNEKRDHIPPVVSASAVTFPFAITVAGCVPGPPGPPSQQAGWPLLQAGSKAAPHVVYPPVRPAPPVLAANRLTVAHAHLPSWLQGQRRWLWPGRCPAHAAAHQPALCAALRRCVDIQLRRPFCSGGCWHVAAAVHWRQRGRLYRGRWHGSHAPLSATAAAWAMRQLVELLNSIAGSAARLPSGLPPSSGTGSERALGGVLGGGSSSSLQSGDSMGGGMGSAGPPPPLSAAAAAAFPALRAAEAALEAKLADDAAACVADYVRLHVLNERLGARRSFRAAEACRSLNRWGGGWWGLFMSPTGGRGGRGGSLQHGLAVVVWGRRASRGMPQARPGGPVLCMLCHGRPAPAPPLQVLRCVAI